MDNEGRLLVVDDHEAQRELMAVQLEDAGFVVATAVNGEACLELAARELPEAILLDIDMPGMNGIEVCRRLKATPETSQIPVLFLTGWRDDDPMVVEALSVGGNDFVTKNASTQVLVARLKTQVAIRRAHLRIEHMAMHDALTGVFSRHFLFDAMRRALKSTNRTETLGLGCLMIDVDHFKQLNDTVGHMEGDVVLKRIANLVSEAVRETDLVARFGGEEFVVLLPHTTRDGAMLVADKLRSCVDKGAPVTVSIGIAWQERCSPAELQGADGLDDAVQHLIARADRAMYVAKQKGRNRICLWAADVMAG